MESDNDADAESLRASPSVSSSEAAEVVTSTTPASAPAVALSPGPTDAPATKRRKSHIGGGMSPNNKEPETPPPGC